MSETDVKTSSAKAKGRRAVQELKEQLLTFGGECGHTLGDGDFMVVGSGATGEDLWLSPAAQKVYPLVFEVKNQERINIWDSLKQAKRHAEDMGRIPVLAFKRNHDELHVSLRLADFLFLLNFHK